MSIFTQIWHFNSPGNWTKKCSFIPQLNLSIPKGIGQKNYIFTQIQHLNSLGNWTKDMHFHPDALTHQHISIRYCGSFISIQIPFFYEIHVKCESSIQCSTEIIMMTRSMGHHDYLRATLNASFLLHVNFTKKRDLDEKIWSALPYIRKASKNFTNYPIILWVDAGKTDIEFKF